ncbi:MAG: TRAP transporter substrate-binding protein DctP [Burkholderiales bacterium]|nr:TRAP transporter substrate-binding protein DctP [Burkholderiales bacterium]
MFAAYLCLAVAGAVPLHAVAQAYKPEYRLSTAVGPVYPWGKGAAIWAQLIKERTAGRISIRHFPGASAVAGDPAREFAALREGAIDMAVGSALNWAIQVDALNVFALPFLVGDSKALEALLRGEVGVMVMRAIETAGVMPLAWGENDFREISTAQRPVRKPEDLAGLRIRSSGSLLLDDMLGALGAEPVRMKWLDAQNALLERGLDGQDTTVQAFVATQAHSLGQKQFTLWAAAADPLVFAVSRAAWDGWTAADREVVRLAAIEAAARESELARRAAAAAALAMTRDLKGAGVVVTRLTPDERAALAAATRTVFDKWSATAGADLVRRAQDAIAAPRAP